MSILDRIGVKWYFGPHMTWSFDSGVTIVGGSGAGFLTLAGAIWVAFHPFRI